jgi:hypothetical protein
MTTFETRIYSRPPIPLADIGPLEMLILTNVLECSKTEEGLVLFTDFGPTNPVRVVRSELIAAFRASAQYADDPFNTFIANRVLALLPAGGNTSEDDATIDIDLSRFPWQFVVQGIAARSPDLREVTVIQWMNHPSQRLESWRQRFRWSPPRPSITPLASIFSSGSGVWTGPFHLPRRRLPRQKRIALSPAAPQATCSR